MLARVQGKWRDLPGTCAADQLRVDEAENNHYLSEGQKKKRGFTDLGARLLHPEA